MPKNKFTAEDIKRIQSMSFNQLGHAIDSGEYTVKDLRKAYTQMRDIAMKRINRLTSAKNMKEFGKPKLYIDNKEYFRKTKNLIGESELLKEISDVSTFLQSKRSTVSGLKEIRSTLIDNMKKEGFDLDKSDYLDFIKFMNWFKASEFSKTYDSAEKTVAEVWNSTRPSPEDWRRAFEEFAKYENRSAPVRQY